MTATRTRRTRGTGHELRGLVLERATDLLAELGDVDALTMRAVATASGVTPPSLYRHFSDKETLVQAVIAARFEEFTSVLRTAATNAADQPMARLEATARTYVHWGLRQPGHYRVLFSAANAGPAGLGLSPETEHPGAESYRTVIEAVAACLPVPRHDATLILATELWASLHGIVDLRITKPDMSWPAWDQLVDAALGAVRTAATNSSP
ncbi:TetR/AcrR family transcriptional regulator [Iamia sp.]|uniref:TetR/AcrR family transcriptional regulator n=1 Tax=Iamia sp. TaxID=2722710 RepID=UPI002C1F6D34|nr:TetR/AcrR family transcriptional regulator [Iamia sp.]HXH56318.1 TetR/AcrR family transcriptional regulator [Iamia sp.]